MTADRVLVDSVVDMAEIPAFQARREVDAVGDGATSAAEEADYSRRQCAQVAGHVAVSIDGRGHDVTEGTAELGFPPGQAGLATLRLTYALTALIVLTVLVWPRPTAVRRPPTRREST